MSTIGFLGLGNMGGPMALNLVKAGHKVLGFDLSAAASKMSADAGVPVATNATDAVRDADTVITMLPAGKHVLDAYSGSMNLLGVVRPGTLFIDCSTIDIASARAASAAATKAGMLSVDAPVSGGVGGASGATLTFMVGGADEAFAKAKPILEAMGKKIVHCGGAGNGQAAKICNNMVLGISMIGVGEAFVLAKKLGLSEQALFDVASTSSGSCWSLNTYCPVPGPVPTSPANRNYAPGFAVDLMLKDLRLSQEASRASGAATPMGAAASQLFELFAAQGHGGLDFSAIVTFLNGTPGKAP
ncbi:MAG: 3-hydroxyisobutyrate dehydrogenase [Rhizobiales bacterium PAR1]|nr:MAG: 3-hydroxyisobutyrate dehydrogenase [Rhizobiales bacterium PAR1]